MRFAPCRNLLSVIAGVFTGLFIGATFHPAPAQNADAPPAVQRASLATRIQAPPTIDGKFDDACWQGLPVNGGFVSTETGMPAEPNTAFRVAYDQNALYLAIELKEPHIDLLKGEALKHDDVAFWHGDTVEIFLQPNPRQSAYYQLAVNPKSSQFDALDRDGNVDIDWTAKATVEPGQWDVEAAIPWTSIGVSQYHIGPLMRLNVCRTRSDAGPKKPAANSAWSRLTKAFHERNDFGFLVFTDYDKITQQQNDDLKARLDVVRQLTPESEHAQLEALSQRLASPVPITTEEQFREGLRLQRAVEGDLNRLIEAIAAAPNQGEADLLVSHLDPYSSIAKDRSAQLIYYAEAMKADPAAVKLQFTQSANEYEHDGLALSSRSGIKGLRVDVTDLTGPKGSKIPASKIRYYSIGYIDPAPEEDFNYVNWNKVPAPDLVEEIRKPVDLGAFESKQIWVTVHSTDSAPGDYRGALHIRDAAGKILKTVPIGVTVWPITLPKRPALGFYAFSGIPWGGKSGELWADFMVDHYVTYVAMELPTDIYAGKQHIAHQGRELADIEIPVDVKNNKVDMGGKEWDHFERLKIIRSRGLKLEFNSGEGILPKAVLPAFVQYLKKAGFGYDDFRYKISDEDMSDDKLPMFKAYHAADPKMRLVFTPAGSWDITGFSPYTDTYMCSYSVTAWKEWLPYFQAEQKRGKHVTIYTNWPSWSGRAPLEQIRQDLSWIWQIGVPEYCVWTSMIYPPLNYVYPYSGAPMVNISNRSPEHQSTSTLIYFRREGNVFYPVSSKRLEAVRDGYTDWMYLKMVSDLLDRARTNIPTFDGAAIRAELNALAARNPRTRADFAARKATLAKHIVSLQDTLRKGRKAVH